MLGVRTDCGTTNAIDDINARLDQLAQSSTAPNRPPGESPAAAVEFLQLLGNGAFGEVWRARWHGKLVAAKVTGCPTGFRVEEVAALRMAQGAHTVRFLGEASTSKGAAIIMELCSGSLDQQLSLARSRNQPCTTEQFLQLLLEIASGLAAMHQQQLLFGDLKPDNLLIGPNGQLLFSDFGDARDMRVSVEGRSVHELGWGSPNYHARPDVIATVLTVASDVWMLAQTMVHVWTLAPPTSNPSAVPADIPLRALWGQCLSVAAAARPSAEEMVQRARRELHRLLDESTVSVQGVHDSQLQQVRDSSSGGLGHSGEVALEPSCRMDEPIVGSFSPQTVRYTTTCGSAHTQTAMPLQKAAMPLQKAQKTALAERLEELEKRLASEMPCSESQLVSSPFLEASEQLDACDAEMQFLKVHRSSHDTASVHDTASPHDTASLHDIASVHATASLHDTASLHKTLRESLATPQNTELAGVRPFRSRHEDENQHSRELRAAQGFLAQMAPSAAVEALEAKLKQTSEELRTAQGARTEEEAERGGHFGGNHEDESQQTGHAWAQYTAVSEEQSGSPELMLRQAVAENRELKRVTAQMRVEARRDSEELDRAFEQQAAEAERVRLLEEEVAVWKEQAGVWKEQAGMFQAEAERVRVLEEQVAVWKEQAGVQQAAEAEKVKALRNELALWNGTAAWDDSVGEWKVRDLRAQGEAAGVAQREEAAVSAALRDATLEKARLEQQCTVLRGTVQAKIEELRESELKLSQSTQNESDWQVHCAQLGAQIEALMKHHAEHRLSDEPLEVAELEYANETLPDRAPSERSAVISDVGDPTAREPAEQMRLARELPGATIRYSGSTELCRAISQSQQHGTTRPLVSSIIGSKLAEQSHMNVAADRAKRLDSEIAVVKKRLHDEEAALCLQLHNTGVS